MQMQMQMQERELSASCSEQRVDEAEPDYFDLLLFVPYMAMPIEEVEKMWETSRQKREEAQQD